MRLIDIDEVIRAYPDMTEMNTILRQQKIIHRCRQKNDFKEYYRRLRNEGKLPDISSDALATVFYSIFRYIFDDEYTEILNSLNGEKSNSSHTVKATNILAESLGGEYEKVCQDFLNMVVQFVKSRKEKAV